MTKNPLYNGSLATLYISLVASFMYYGTRVIGPIEGPIVPAAFLSLFVLSVAVMAFLFFYQPFRLYFDGQKSEALGLFLKTLGVFAVITFVFLSALFLLPFAL